MHFQNRHNHHRLIIHYNAELENWNIQHNRAPLLKMTAVCDETQNLNETESETFFPIPNFFDTKSDTFFQYQFFSDTDTFFDTRIFQNQIRYFFDTKIFRNRYRYFFITNVFENDTETIKETWR